ncbi:MAG: GxxExxY protein [Chryseolinea sp.]
MEKHNRELLNQISADILDGAMTVHKLMGPGLLESVYHHCLLLELTSRGLKIESMVPVKLRYKDAELNKTFYADMMVEDAIILELKAVETIIPVHEAQVLSYLRLADKRLGFLINFNVVLLKNGFKRFVNNF